MELDSSSITIMSVSEYLSVYLPTNYSILTLYESLLTKSNCKIKGNEKHYEEYLPVNVLREGLVSVSFKLHHIYSLGSIGFIY